MEKNKQRRPFIRAVALVLFLTVATSFVSCHKDRQIEKVGIDIKENETVVYTDSLRLRAEDTVRRLLTEIYTEYVGTEPANKHKEDIEKIAPEVAAISMDGRISEREYASVLDTLDEYGSSAVVELIGYMNGETYELNKAKELYLSLSNCASSDYVGRLFYNLATYTYDYKYESTMEKYEKYQYAYLLEDAEALAKERERFISGVGEKNFSLVLSLGFAMSELFVGGAFEDERMEAFSDRELLVFIEHLDIESLDITPDGWELLFSFLVSDDRPTEPIYSRALFYHAYDTGDITRLSEVMDRAVYLLSYMQATLDCEMIAKLRRGELEDTIGNIISGFGENEWEAFSELTSFMSDGTSYDTVALKYYPTEYPEYRENGNTLTLDELKSNASGEKIYESFEGYLRGKSCALAFLLKK